MTRQTGFTLTELLAVVAILAAIAVVMILRTSDEHDRGKVAACHVYKGDIEIQSEIWMHNTGSWPAANLADIGADLEYFPEGLPTCPVDGSAYTIDTTTGRIIGHNH